MTKNKKITISNIVEEGAIIIKQKLKRNGRKYYITQLKEVRKVVMTLAHCMRKGKKWSMSEALRWAWKMVKHRITTKVAGVSFGKRQEAIKRLCNYAPRRVVFTLRREEENPYDENAIAVDVTVIGKGTFHMGYLPKDIAQILTPLLDKNHLPSITNWETLGEGTKGIKLKMELIPGIAVINESKGFAKQYSALIAIR